MEFYIAHNGQQHGPFSEAQVRASLDNGTLSVTDLAWHEGASAWQSISSFPSFARQSATPPPIPVRSTPPPIPIQLPPAAAPIDLPQIGPNTLGPYARTTLQPNETPVYKTSLHWIVLLDAAILALLSTIFLVFPGIVVSEADSSQIGWLGFLLPALIFLVPLGSLMTSELVITDKRVLIKIGIIRRHTMEMFVSKIESVAVNQGIVGRMFDYGTVTIRGTGGTAEPFKVIAHPIEFRNYLQRIQSHVERR